MTQSKRPRRAATRSGGNELTKAKRTTGPTGNSNTGRKGSDTYVYEDESGAPIFRVVRKAGKRFHQEWFDGDKWVKGLGDVRRVPYNLSAIAEAAKHGKPVWITEGEKDANALIAQDLTATTNPGGAGNNKWKDDYSHLLMGVKRAHIVYDNDEEGRKHALRVGESLRKFGIPFKYLRAKEGKDVSDHLGAGYSLDELVEESPGPPLSASNESAEPAKLPDEYAAVLGSLYAFAAANGLPAPRKTDHGWECSCPNHDDRKPSLGIRVGDDRAVVLKCQAGCPETDVIAALGLDPKRILRATREPATATGFVVRTANLRRSRPFEWLWDQRVLLGYLNLIAGEEGVGKSTLVGWLGAQVTRGRLPGTLEGQQRRVLVVGDEDDWDNVWTPRFKANGAQLRLCKNVASGTAGAFDVTNPDDIAKLTDYVTANDVVFVFFDQILDNLGYTDNWKDKQVRDALAPVRSFARSTNTAVLMTLHPNKRPGSFRNRVSGTPAFNALSRSSLFVARHPDDEARVVVVRPKGNYAEEPSAVEFRIVKTTVKPPKQEPLVTAAVKDVRETPMRAADVLDASPSRRQEDSNIGRCRKALSELLADGKPHLVSEVMQELKEHWSERDIRRASEHIKVEKHKQGFGDEGGWTWQRI